MIRVQLSTSLELSSKMICKFCHSHFSHVDIVMPDGNLIGASNSPDAPFIEGNPCGVAIRPPEYQKFGMRRMAVAAIHSDRPKEIEDNFYKVLLSQLGKPFDDSALYAFISSEGAEPRNWRQDDLWFCSEYAAWAFEIANFFPYELITAKNRITPADLLLLLNPFINVNTFWLPIEGLVLGPHEK